MRCSELFLNHGHDDRRRQSFARDVAEREPEPVAGGDA